MMASRKNQCKTYKASITREPFLFYEMRTTAKLMVEGLSNDEIIEKQKNCFINIRTKRLSNDVKELFKDGDLVILQ